MMLVISFLSPQQHIYTAMHAHTMIIIIIPFTALHDFVEWRDDAALVKTKEIVTDQEESPPSQTQ